MIKRLLCIVTFVFVCTTTFAEPAIEVLDSNFAAPDAEKGLLWYDALQIGLEGQGWSGDALKTPYDRLPAKAEGVVRPPVWNLSLHSAGMALHFVTDSKTIAARWTLRNENLAMTHMPATGVSGLDLYARDDKGEWRWCAMGMPGSKANEVNLLSNIPEGQHEFLLYLPLYNGVESLAIGIEKEASLAKGPARAEGHNKPILFYGTSITHGGCASRPGMAHPSIVGRMLDYPVINLGFSGNGKLDPELLDLLIEQDPAVYVLDCAPNMQPDLIAERTVPFIEGLRKARPDTPILLVENIVYQQGWLIKGSKDAYINKNIESRKAYEILKEKGMKNLGYLPCEDLLGHDSEGTVDGTHPNDLGFYRFAEAMTPALKKLLK